MKPVTVIEHPAPKCPVCGTAYNATHGGLLVQLCYPSIVVYPCGCRVKQQFKPPTPSGTPLQS